LCGGSELWLGSAMPSWRMAGWLWRMAEASRKSLRWRKEEGSCWEGELCRLIFSAASEVEWGSYCWEKTRGIRGSEDWTRRMIRPSLLVFVNCW
jgi:hypothetical protein